MPSRRTVLAAGGTALVAGLAGCSNPLSSDPPTVSASEVTIEKSTCTTDGQRRRTATTSYDRSTHELSVRGVTRSRAPCTELYANVDDGVGHSRPDNAMHVIVDIRRVGECSPCRAELEYTATVRFSHDPSSVAVLHTEQFGDDLRPVGPIASRQIG